MAAVSRRAAAVAALSAALALSGCSDKPVETSKGTIYRYYTPKGRMRIPGLRNSSGMTFNPDTGTLFIVQDSPPMVREISPDGELIRSWKIDNVDDIEGVAYLGNGRFALAEESSGKIRFFHLEPNAAAVTLEEKTIQAAPPTDDNTGIEGICASPDGKTLYVVEEKTPKKIYKIDLASGKTSSPWRLETLDIGDASGLSPAPKPGHILILSQESRKIVECDEKGNVLATLSLEKRRNGLRSKPVDKPEGIALDPKSKKVFICGEPDMFYVFEPTTQK